ncbi:hypothetical protein M3Y99_00521100 [Aphelenchoides fujianensis]|nr:hypothetical protein M3Y99_00521100 [Aphelenchoides fujianensis]
MPKFAALFLLFFFLALDGVHADYGGYDAARTVGSRRTGGERDPLVLPSNLPHKPNEYEGASHFFWYENKPFAHAHGGHEETYGGKLHQHHAVYGSDQLDGNNFITDPPGVGLNAQENRDNYEKPKPSVDFDVVENSATANPHAHRVHPTTAASTREVNVDVGAAHSSTPSSSSSSSSSPLQVPYKSAHAAEEKVDEDGAPNGPNGKEDTKVHVSAHEYESSVTSTSTKLPCCACCAEQSESAGGGHSPATSKTSGSSTLGPSTSAPSTSAYVRSPTSSYVNPLTPFAPLTSLTSTGSQSGGGGGSYAISPSGGGGSYATSRTGGGGFYATSGGGGGGGGCAGSGGFNAGCGSSACGCQQAPAPCCPQLPTCCVQLQLRESAVPSSSIHASLAAAQLPCCPRIEFCCPQQPLCCQPTGCGVCRSRALRARRVKRTGCVSCAGRKKRDVLDEIHVRRKRLGCVPCLRRRKREQPQCANCSPFTRQLVSRVKRSFLSTCSPCANRKARAKREAEIAVFHVRAQADTRTRRATSQSSATSDWRRLVGKRAVDPAADLEYDSPLQCDRSCCDYSKCLKSKPLTGRK